MQGRGRWGQLVQGQVKWQGRGWAGCREQGREQGRSPTAGVAVEHGCVREVADGEAGLGRRVWLVGRVVGSPHWHRRGHGHSGEGTTSTLGRVTVLWVR